MRLTAPQALARHEVAIVDVEGNGGQPPEIVEIAVLRLGGAIPVAAPSDVRAWLVRPARPIAAVLTRTVHGISNSTVAHSPPWAAVAGEVAALLAGRVLVAHHATVERRVLGAHLPEWRPPLVLDTLRLAKSVWPALPSHRLEHLIAHAHLPVPAGELTGPDGKPAGRHRASYDTWMTAALFIALIEHAGLDWTALTARAALPAPDTPARPATATPTTTPTPTTAPSTASTAASEQEGLW